jgi:hypothetical protein
MSENLPDYTELDKNERANVLHNLAQAAIDIIANHPDTMAEDVIVLLHYKPYGCFAWLAIQRAIKEGVLVANSDNHHTWLRVPAEQAS